MIVLSPPEVDAPVAETTTETVSPLEVNTVDVNEFGTDTVQGVLNESRESTETSDVGDGFTQSETTSIENNSPSQGSNNLTQNVNLSTNSNGEVQFSQETIESFDILGISIEDMSVIGNSVEILVTDVKVGQTYQVTLSDGNPLPEGIVFDPITGSIKGEIAGDLEELDITIKAIDSDGNSRILNLKIQLSELKANNSFISLQEQLSLEASNMETYGNQINSLFINELV